MTTDTTVSDHDGVDGHDDFGGLGRDVGRLMGRRRALLLLGGVGLAGLAAACGDDDAATTTSTSSSTTRAGDASTTSSLATDVTAASGAEIPDETAGPYPADGSNGPNVLTESGIVRSDLTSSFGSYSGIAEGVPTAIQLSVVDATTGSALVGAAVYLWHCTADGRYSIYEVTDQNYLRGVTETDSAGRATFTTVFPGCYSGRWPHCHFEVFSSLADASAGSQAVKTSQLALPEADCNVVYAQSAYGNSSGNLSRLSLDSDGIFRDGWTDQLATVSGSVDDGYVLSLLVRV